MTIEVALLITTLLFGVWVLYRMIHYILLFEKAFLLAIQPKRGNCDVCATEVRNWRENR